MDFSNKTKPELVAICKERNIQGYSGKKKEDILLLLTNNASIAAPLRYIDLFCGLGAFHTAFNTSSRFQCVLASDIDEGVRNIYKANYGLEPKGDIRKIESVPDFDILCAGFPCQPFSIAGNGEGFKDSEKGNLFYDILKIIDSKKPRMCILENVKNLETHDKGKTFQTIRTELVNRGYLFVSKVINSADYGSPQARQRIFMIATLGKPFVIPTIPKVTKPVASIIDLTVDRNDLNMTRYTIKEKALRKKADASKPRILYDVFPVLSKEKQEKLKGVAAKGGRQGERVYSIDSVGITVCASSGGPGAKTGLYKVGEKIRRLTVTETLGMFGFPKTYLFPNTKDEDALFYLGNSIVVDIPKSFVSSIEQWFQ